jgi:hypothetical protein
MLTDFAACVLQILYTGDTFTHGRYFRPTCELLSPWTKELYLYLCTVTVLPLYHLSDLLPLPPSQSKCTEYTDSVWGGEGVELCCRPYSEGV